MKKKNYIPNQDEEFIIWETNFSDNIDAYVPVLGLVQADVDNVKAAIQNHKIAYQTAFDAKANASTATRAAQNSRSATEALIRTLVKDIKNKPDYNNEIEADLKLAGAEMVIDYNTVKPIISKITVLSDQVIIDWIRGYMQGVLIHCALRTPRNTNPQTLSSGNDLAGLITGWEKLDKDYRSPYEDKRPNLNSEPEVRYYKLRYLLKDEPVGLDSEIYRTIVDIQPIAQ